MEEIKLNIENLSADEREQLMKLVEKAQEKEKDVWPKVNDVYYYYYSSNGDIWQEVWIDGYIDKGRYGLGDCFKTEEEAEFALERHKVIVELERFAKEHNKRKLDWGYCIVYDNLSNKVAVHLIQSNFLDYGVVFFESAKTADEAIKQIGKERLKKYYFEVE